MMFVVRDERVFTERKNRLASIPEGKGIWAPCASYTSYWGIVDFGLKQKVFKLGLHVFFPLFYGFNPECCVFIWQLYNLKHIKSSRKDINMFLMAACSHLRNLFRLTWFKINCGYLVGFFLSSNWSFQHDHIMIFFYLIMKLPAVFLLYVLSCCIFFRDINWMQTGTLIIKSNSLSLEFYLYSNGVEYYPVIYVYKWSYISL